MSEGKLVKEVSRHELSHISARGLVGLYDRDMVSYLEVLGCSYLMTLLFEVFVHNSVLGRED